MTDPPGDYNLDFNQVAQMLAHRPHVNTVRRWATVGVQDVKLESAKIGGRRFTSAAALARFITRLSELHPPGSACPPRVASQRRNILAAERAKSILISR